MSIIILENSDIDVFFSYNKYSYLFIFFNNIMCNDLFNVINKLTRNKNRQTDEHNIFKLQQNETIG